MSAEQDLLRRFQKHVPTGFQPMEVERWPSLEIELRYRHPDGRWHLVRVDPSRRRKSHLTLPARYAETNALIQSVLDGTFKSNPAARKHHFLTRSLQDSFLAPGQQKLWIYSKEDGVLLPNRLPPVHAFRRRNYYQLTGNDGNRKNLEQFFGVPETDAMLLADKLKWGSPLSLDERWSFSFFIAIHYVRVPRVIEAMRGLADHFLDAQMHQWAQDDQSLAMALDVKEGEALEEARQWLTVFKARQDLKVSVAREDTLLSLVGMLKYLVPFIYGMCWSVLIAPSDRFFILSDAAVVLRHPHHDPLVFEIPLQDKRTTLLFPLAYTHYLELSHNPSKRWSAPNRLTKTKLDALNQAAVKAAHIEVAAPFASERVCDLVKTYSRNRAAEEERLRQLAVQGVERAKNDLSQ